MSSSLTKRVDELIENFNDNKNDFEAAMKSLYHMNWALSELRDKSSPICLVGYQLGLGSSYKEVAFGRLDPKKIDNPSELTELSVTKSPCFHSGPYKSVRRIRLPTKDKFIYCHKFGSGFSIEEKSFPMTISWSNPFLPYFDTLHPRNVNIHPSEGKGIYIFLGYEDIQEQRDWECAPYNLLNDIPEKKWKEVRAFLRGLK